MLALIALLSAAVAPAQAAAAAKEVERIIAASNELGFSLYGELSGQDGNLLLSPCGLSASLAMVYGGARGNTGTEMAKVLGFRANDKAFHGALAEMIRSLSPPARKKNYEFTSATALWARQDAAILDEFTALVTRGYGAELNQVDFAGDGRALRERLNAWVERRTGAQVKFLLEPGAFDLKASLSVTNAVYFRANWQVPFKSDLTMDTPFTRIGQEKIDVPMMLQTARLRCVDGDGFQALELPYAGGELAMILLLPEKPDGIKALEKRLSQKNVAAWLAELKGRDVRVCLPKFKIPSELSLKAALTALGMKDAFGATADFAGMTAKKGDLLLSGIVQTAALDVHETGSDVTAPVTVVGTRRAGSAPAGRARIVAFRADHPFIFLVRDTKTGCILFLGRVMNPKG